MLDVDAEVGQKTVVITRSAQEVEEVFKVQHASASSCDERVTRPGVLMFSLCRLWEASQPSA